MNLYRLGSEWNVLDVQNTKIRVLKFFLLIILIYFVNQKNDNYKMNHNADQIIPIFINIYLNKLE